MPDFRQKNYSGGNRNFRGDRGNFRDRDRGNRNYNDRDGNKEMFDAVCDDCGRNCRVPFQPTSGKPIYCSDCFRDKRDSDERPSRGNFNTPQSSANSSKDLSALNSKLDKIISLLERQLDQNTPKQKEIAMIVKPEMAIVEQKPKASAKRVVAKKSSAKKAPAKKAAKKSKYLEE